MADLVAYSGGKWVTVTRGGSGGGLPTLTSANYVLAINGAGTLSVWSLITTSNISETAGITATQLAAGAAGTVLAGGTSNAFTATPTVTSITVGTVKRSAGSGTPEGSVVGSVGDIYCDTGGGAGTVLYVKESGTATDTGWVAYGGAGAGWSVGADGNAYWTNAVTGVVTQVTP